MMSIRKTIIVVIWYLSNFVGLGLAVFSDRPIIKIVAVVFEAIAISTSGLMVIGGLFCKSDEHH